MMGGGCDGVAIIISMLVDLGWGFPFVLAPRGMRELPVFQLLGFPLSSLELRAGNNMALSLPRSFRCSLVLRE